MIWRRLWGSIRRCLVDQSEPVKSGQNDRNSCQFPLKEHGSCQHAYGCQTQDAIVDKPPSAPAGCPSNPRAEATNRHERDLEALSENWYPPDIYAFAHYLRDNEEERIELLFDDLWSSYVNHCDESNRRAMTPRQLQNAWKKVGHTRRENTAVAPRRRWYVLEDVSLTHVEASAETHVVAILYKGRADR